MNEGGLDIQNLTVTYGRRTVISNLSIGGLRNGQITALVGPNGSGKSSLLRAIAGLVPALGAVTLNGEELLSLAPPRRARRVAFLPQEIQAPDSLLALEATIVALKLSDPGSPVTTLQVQRDAMAALERLGVASLALEPLDRLSGGQRQLVGLAAVVGRHAPLILLDEPTSALDLRSQIEVMAIFRELSAHGSVMIVVLHDLELAGRWTDNIVVLNQGRLFAMDRPSEAITPEMLAAVYGVEGRVESCSKGDLHIVADHPINRSDTSSNKLAS